MQKKVKRIVIYTFKTWAKLITISNVDQIKAPFDAFHPPRPHVCGVLSASRVSQPYAHQRFLDQT
jgi:hypothetical protein